MRRPVLIRLVLALSFAGLMTGAVALPAHAQQDAQVLTLSSPDFNDGGVIPSKYTCDAGGASPALHFDNVPSHTASFALTVTDPDAPGGAYTHWIVYNLPGKIRDLPAGAAGTATLGLDAQQGLNSKTQTTYDAPCPPSGEHHYIFRLYALSTTLALPTGFSVDRKALDAALEGHVLAQAELTGRYARHTPQ